MLEPMCCWRMFSRGKCNAVSIQFVAVAPYKLTKWPQWRRPTRQRAFTWSRGYEWEWKADGERGSFTTANGLIKGVNNPSWTFLFRCRGNGTPWLDFAVVFALRLSTSVLLSFTLPNGLLHGQLYSPTETLHLPRQLVRALNSAQNYLEFCFYLGRIKCVLVTVNPL